MKRFKRILATAVAAISACSLFAFTACDKDDEKGGAVGGATVGGNWSVAINYTSDATRNELDESGSTPTEKKIWQRSAEGTITGAIKDADNIGKMVVDLDQSEDWETKYDKDNSGELPSGNTKYGFYYRHGTTEPLKAPQLFMRSEYKDGEDTKEEYHFNGDTIAPITAIYSMGNDFDVIGTIVGALEGLGSIGGVVTKNNGVITIDYVANYRNAVNALDSDLNNAQKFKTDMTVGAFLSLDSVKGILGPALGIFTPEQVKMFLEEAKSMVPDVYGAVVDAVLAVQPDENSDGHAFLIKALNDDTVAEKLATLYNPEAQAPYKKVADYTFEDIGELLGMPGEDVKATVKQYVSAVYSGTTASVAKLTLPGGEPDNPMMQKIDAKEITLNKVTVKITESNNAVSKIEADIDVKIDEKVHVDGAGVTMDYVYSSDNLTAEATLTANNNVQIKDISSKEVEYSLYEAEDTTYPITISLSDYGESTDIQIDVTFENGAIKTVTKHANASDAPDITWSATDKTISATIGENEYVFTLDFDMYHGLCAHGDMENIYYYIIPKVPYKATIGQILSGEKGTKVTDGD